MSELWIAFRFAMRVVIVLFGLLAVVVAVLRGEPYWLVCLFAGITCLGAAGLLQDPLLLRLLGKDK